MDLKQIGFFKCTYDISIGISADIFADVVYLRLFSPKVPFFLTGLQHFYKNGKDID